MWGQGPGERVATGAAGRSREWPARPTRVKQWQINGQVMVKDMAALTARNAGNPDVLVRRGTNRPGPHNPVRGGTGTCRRWAASSPVTRSAWPLTSRGAAGERCRADGWLAGLTVAGRADGGWPTP